MLAPIMAEKILEEVENEILNCAVCLQKYTDPKLLQCFHIYCLACIRRLPREDQDQLPCPECRQITHVPEGGVKNLKPAFHINRLIGIIDSKGNREEQKEEKRCCSDHADEEVKLYCEPCGKLICFKCVIKGADHHTHDHELLDDAFKRYKEEVSSSLAQVKKQKMSTEQAMKQLHSTRREILDKKKAIEDDLEGDVRKTQLMSQFRRITYRKLEGLKAEEKQLKTTQARLKGCLDFMKESIETNSHHEVLEMKAALIEKIKELTIPSNLHISSTDSIATNFSLDIVHFKGETLTLLRPIT